jgi:hypothetical protein
VGWGRGEGAVDGVCEDVAGEGVVADDVGGGGDGVVDWDVFGGELEDYFYFTFTFYFHFLLSLFAAGVLSSDPTAFFNDLTRLDFNSHGTT